MAYERVLITTWNPNDTSETIDLLERIAPLNTYIFVYPHILLGTTQYIYLKITNNNTYHYEDSVVAPAQNHYTTNIFMNGGRIMYRSIVNSLQYQHFIPFSVFLFLLARARKEETKVTPSYFSRCNSKNMDHIHRPCCRCMLFVVVF